MSEHTPAMEAEELQEMEDEDEELQARQAEEAQELAAEKAALIAFLTSPYDSTGFVVRDALFTGLDDYGIYGLDDWLEEQLDDALDDDYSVTRFQSLAVAFERLAWKIRYVLHEY